MLLAGSGGGGGGEDKDLDYLLAGGSGEDEAREAAGSRASWSSDLETHADGMVGHGRTWLGSRTWHLALYCCVQFLNGICVNIVGPAGKTLESRLHTTHGRRRLAEHTIRGIQ